MATRTALTEVRYCAPCATGDHSRCTVDVATRHGALCECGARGHDPVVDVAAQMARYVWGEHAAGLPVEEQATSWRRGCGVDR